MTSGVWLDWMPCPGTEVVVPMPTRVCPKPETLDPKAQEGLEMYKEIGGQHRSLSQDFLFLILTYLCAPTQATHSKQIGAFASHKKEFCQRSSG